MTTDLMLAETAPEEEAPSTPAAPVTGRSPRRAAAAALAVYALLAVALFAGAWRSPTRTSVGGTLDPPLHMWFLRWTPWALSHGHLPFFTHHLNFPVGVNLLWNTFLPLPAIVLWPVTVSLGPIAALNTFVTLNVALSAWSAYLLVRSLVTSRAAAFVAGLVYGFGPYMAAHSAEHSNLTAAFVPPLLFLALAEILVRQRRSARRSGVALGLLLLCQLLITEELLATEAIAGVVGVAVLIVLHRREVAARARHALRSLGWSAGVFLPLAAPLLLYQFFGPRPVHGVIQPPNVFVSDLANFVSPTGFQAVGPGGPWSVRHWTGNPLEHTAYLGVPLLALLIYAAAKLWARPLVRFCTILGASLAVLSLGAHLHVGGRDTHIPLPWGWFERLPVVANILPARLTLYVDLLVAVLLAVFVDHLLGRRPRGRRVPGLIAVAAVVLSLAPVVPYPTARIDLPRFFTGEGVRRIREGSVVLVAPWQQLYPSAPMLWQAASGMRYRMAQGYFIAPGRDGKPMYGATFSRLSFTMLRIQGGNEVEMTDAVRADIQRDLRAIDVSSIVVGPMDHQDKMLQFFASLLGRDPEPVDGVYVWWNVGAEPSRP